MHSKCIQSQKSTSRHSNTLDNLKIIYAITRNHRYLRKTKNGISMVQ